MTPTKPGRPFGLTLAILACALLFGVLPLVQFSAVLLVRNHFQRNVDLAAGMAAVDPSSQPIFQGMSGLPELNYWLLVMGGGFLTLAYLAWRGRPAWTRWLMQGAVLLLTLLNVAAVLLLMLPPRDAAQGISSGDQLGITLGLWQIALSVLVALYLLWYMNRAPARAFYRGYFLPQTPSPTVPGTERGQRVTEQSATPAQRDG